MNAHDAAVTDESLRPGDAGFAAAARTFFATGRPSVVVQPRDPQAVATALMAAADDDLVVSVRGGGHSPLGHSTNIGGMVIDLAHLDTVEVLDAERRLVRVGGGATWGKVSTALEAYGWAITSGDTTGVGVGGLTLGGGIGWLVRRDGLTIDNLVGARVVTADGRLFMASQDEHAELFWALRGGGGNFGIVVDFDFIAQPVSGVHFGTLTYQLDDPAALIGRWRDAMRAAPDELSSTIALAPPTPSNTPAAVVLFCHAGTPGRAVSDADAAIQPLLELGTVTSWNIAERSYVEILDDAVPPPDVRLVTRDALVSTLDDAMIARLLRVHGGPVPAAIAIRSLGGAFGRVPAGATAFAHRDAEAMIVALLRLPDTASDADVQQALQPWSSVETHALGTYINIQGSATAADLEAAYPPETYARLAAIKRAYDPGNRFALNHNIEPSTPRRARRTP